MDIKRHFCDEIFQTDCREKNVYTQIKEDGYICTGATIYTAEKMEKMLDESGLSVDEMKKIYDYYYEDLVMPDINEMTLHFFLWHNTHSSAESAMADFRRNDTDGRVSKKLRGLLFYNEWLRWLIVIQLLMFVAIAIVGCIGKISAQVMLRNALLLALSWLLALFIANYSKCRIDKGEDSLIWNMTGGVIAKELDDLAYDRTWAAYSIQNTWLMYDVLKRRIEKSQNKEKTA